MTILHKATENEVSDDLEFVLSDATVDRYGDVVEPNGWKLDHFKRNPIALFAHDSRAPIGRWENVRVEKGKLLGKLVLLAKGLSPRIDELRALIEHKILRAVSVGFRPIKSEPIPDSPNFGVRYLAAELVETSLVSVPANPAALAIVKSLGVSTETTNLIFGESADRTGLVGRGPQGDNRPRPQHNGPGKMTLADRLQHARAEIVRLRDAATGIVTKDGDPDADDLAQLEALNGDIEARTKSLGILEQMERNLGLGSSVVIPSAGPQVVPAASAPAIHNRPPARPEKKGDLFIRGAVVQVMALLQNKEPQKVLGERYRDDERVAVMAGITKAAVAGATTTTT